MLFFGFSRFLVLENFENPKKNTMFFFFFFFFFFFWFFPVFIEKSKKHNDFFLWIFQLKQPKIQKKL